MHGPTLDIDLLRTFLAIADSGNFSRAAERVNRTPSAVSLQVRRLEDAAGRQLFRRSTREVALTEDGEILIGYARRILELHDAASARLLPPKVEGKVRLGAPNDSGIYALPKMLGRFAGTHPQVDVDVRLDASRNLRNACEAGELDLVIYTNAAETEANGGRIYEEELVWVGRRNGLASERRPLPLALAEAGCAWRARALDGLSRVGIDYRIAYTSEHCQGQIAAVEADLAVAPLPISVARPPFVRLGSDSGLPDLGRYNVYLRLREGAGPATRALASHVSESFEAAAGFGERLFA